MQEVTFMYTSLMGPHEGGVGKWPDTHARFAWMSTRTLAATIKMLG